MKNILVKKGKTNWIMIVVVAVIAGAAGGGSVMYINQTIAQTMAMSQSVQLNAPKNTNTPRTNDQNGNIQPVPVQPTPNNQ
jgi:flagellar basal body-associated protein FliL